MLIQFTVENVLSFREEAVLNLRAAPGVAHADGQTASVVGLGDVLRVAAIYGANGSGKSNLVSALALGRRLALGGTRPGEPIAVSPFKLDPDCAVAPSRVEFELAGDGRRWSYGFACTRERVHAEWLYVDDGSGETSVFRREDQRITVDAGLSLDAQRRRLWDAVANETRENQLFVAEANDRSLDELAPLFALLGKIAVLPPGWQTPRLAALLGQDEALLTFASELVRQADTGIANIEVVAGEDTEAGASIRFRHSASEGAMGLPWAEESEGVRRLVEVSASLHRVMTSECTLLMDELDRSLHSLLARHVVEMLVRAHRAGQLLFTTHDTKLLDSSLLSPDSIWFVDKSEVGASTLYSLADFDPEQLERLAPDLERGYLNGRFGATPLFGGARRLAPKTSAS